MEPENTPQPAAPVEETPRDALAEAVAAAEAFEAEHTGGGAPAPEPAAAEPQPPAEPAAAAPAPEGAPAGGRPQEPEEGAVAAPAGVPEDFWRRYVEMDAQHVELRRQNAELQRRVQGSGVLGDIDPEQLRTPDPRRDRELLQRLGFDLDRTLSAYVPEDPNGAPAAAQDQNAPPPWADAIMQRLEAIEAGRKEEADLRTRQSEADRVMRHLTDEQGARWQLINAMRPKGSVDWIVDYGKRVAEEYRQGYRKDPVSYAEIMDVMESSLRETTKTDWRQVLTSAPDLVDELVKIAEEVRGAAPAASPAAAAGAAAAKAPLSPTNGAAPVETPARAGPMTHEEKLQAAIEAAEAHEREHSR